MSNQRAFPCFDRTWASYSRGIGSPAWLKVQNALGLTPWLVKLGPPQFRRYMVTLLPLKAVSDLVSACDHLAATSKNIVKKLRDDSEQRKRHSGDDMDYDSLGSILGTLHSSVY